MHVADRRIS
ncbi:hypothetical protein OYC64_012684 [Pagothenia borchgrevinki]|uniref:Uncharacterized protein n=2 Tax=Notothenioidei TaxID=8205 RepID=A0AAN8CV56_CHAGU|nr:hypothetical protein CgunFtcFv8_016931 [Champsocephalus gunnari]